MPYSEMLAARVREFLITYEPVAELRMMGGLCFMYNDKMLCGIVDEDLMLRVDPASVPELLEAPGCRPMVMGGKSMNGFLLVDDSSYRNPKEFQKWMQLAIDFNPRAKSSRSKKNRGTDPQF